MYKNYHVCSYIHPNLVTGNILVLLIEGARGNGSIGHHILFILNNLGLYANRNSNLSKLVAHLHGQLCGNPHGHHI